MSDDTQSAGPQLPAVVASPSKAPRSVFRTSVRLNPELKRCLEENPGSRIVIRLPGEPGYGTSGGPVRGPAFSMRSWREDTHVCAHCQSPFLVAYGDPPGQATATRNIAVRCPACGRAVAVPISVDVRVDDIEVRPDTSESPATVRP